MSSHPRVWLCLTSLLFLLFWTLLPVPAAPRVLLRFAQISDNHYMVNGPDGSWRLLKDSPALLEDALKQVSTAQGLHFLLFTGDFVNTPKPENFNGFFNLLKQRTRLPAYLVLGNHDVGVQPAQTKEETLKTIKAHTPRGFSVDGKGYYSFSPTKEVQFIVLDGTTDASITANGFLPEEELTWLKKQLELAKDKTVFVALHFPPLEPFPSKSHQIVEPDVTKLLSILEAAPNVSAVFTGHYHSARIKKQNGIYYFCAPALIEYPNAFRIFTLYSDGTLKAEWYSTRLKALQDKSRSRSPWVQNALGNPEKDQYATVHLRFFPTPSAPKAPSVR